MSPRPIICLHLTPSSAIVFFHISWLLVTHLQIRCALPARSNLRGGYIFAIPPLHMSKSSQSGLSVSLSLKISNMPRPSDATVLAAYEGKCKIFDSMRSSSASCQCHRSLSHKMLLHSPLFSTTIFSLLSLFSTRANLLSHYSSYFLHSRKSGSSFGNLFQASITNEILKFGH